MQPRQITDSAVMVELFVHKTLMDMVNKSGIRPEEFEDLIKAAKISGAVSIFQGIPYELRSMVYEVCPGIKCFMEKVNATQ